MRLSVATLVLIAPLWAQTQNCTYSLDKTTVNLPSAATATATINVTATPITCRWLPNVTAGSWIHLATTSQQVVTGSGTFSFSIDANPIGSSRSGNITLVTDNTNGSPPYLTVNQDAAVCHFAFSPSSQNFSVNGGNGTVNVTANCSWAVSNAAGNWVNIPYSTAGGITNATVPFTVAGNGCVTARSGTIVLNGSSLSKPLTSTITQDGSPSNFSLSATGATADATASDNRLGITTGDGCGWSASSDVSWMQITSPAAGSGNGNLAYHLIPNTSAARTGNIHVNAGGGVQFLFTVTQAAPGPPAPAISSVANAANYAADAVSPGEIVTIFGQNMGPRPLVPLQISSGLLTTTLGGTQVLFDGVPAPMIYSLDSQVSAIVPYGLAGKSSTQVQVSYNGSASAAVTMRVQASTPAIFTLDASGLGPGAILNQDFSVNSSSLPAARGSVVAIYCTGGGTVSPAITDGSIVGATLPQLTLLSSVTIGGLDAKVSYAGLVPSSIAGLVQINAEVPANATVGGKIPIVVMIGNASSSAGVTIAVK
jgi:uncharacterized protein (TIGR03437 family)